MYDLSLGGHDSAASRILTIIEVIENWIEKGYTDMFWTRRKRNLKEEKLTQSSYGDSDKRKEKKFYGKGKCE